MIRRVPAWARVAVAAAAVAMTSCGGKRGKRGTAAAPDAGALTPEAVAPAGPPTASGLPAALEPGVPPAAREWKATVLPFKGLARDAAFGTSVAAAGDVLVVGAPGAPFVDGVIGSAHVFERHDGVWRATARLTPPRPHRGFGDAVALSGDRIAVSSHDGVVELFERTGARWRATASLTLPSSGDIEYSPALALDGDTLAVGLSDWMERGKAEGRVVLYGRDAAGAWTERARLAASDAAARSASGESPNFGWAVALDGDELSVTARQASCESGTEMCGAVHLFRRSGDTWTEELALPRAELRRWAMLGVHLAAAGGDQALFCDGEQRAWMLRHGAAGWTETGTLELPAGARDPKHGHAIAVRGGLAVISSYAMAGTARPPVIPGTNEIDTAAMAAQRGSAGGALHVFARTPSAWAFLTTLTWPDDVAGSELGTSVAITGDTLIAGAPRAQSTGAVVVFSP
ncbi:MAG: hypothetical protein IT370_22920 [Deltaproteobacteria bacterium]|nr:hypothetical protein [Deltaproteobacteria bacterium]